MEESRASNPTLNNIDQGLVSFPRDPQLPAYYSVKIDSLSRLVDLKIEKYESSTFHAGGFEWRLVIYPNGKADEDGEGHISLYLAIDNTDTLPPGWEVYVSFKMFVFSPQYNKKDLTIPDVSVFQIRRFHQARKEIGDDRLISQDTLNASTKGYLTDNPCVFGVEIHEVKYSGNGEGLKVIQNPTEVTFNWKISIHPKERQYCSQKFSSGTYKWRLRLDMNLGSRSNGRQSLYLELADSPSTVKRVLVDFSLVIKTERSMCDKCEGDKWFSTSTKELISEFDFPRSLYLITQIMEGSVLLEIEAKLNIKAEVTNFS